MHKSMVVLQRIRLGFISIIVQKIMQSHQHQLCMSICTVKRMHTCVSLICRKHMIGSHVNACCKHLHMSCMFPMMQQQLCGGCIQGCQRRLQLTAICCTAFIWMRVCHKVTQPHLWCLVCIWTVSISFSRNTCSMHLHRCELEHGYQVVHCHCFCLQTILCCCHIPPPHMRHLLECLEGICDTNLLAVNVGKTKVLQLRTSRVPRSSINNVEHFQYKSDHIANVDEFKKLGLWFD